MSITKRSSQNGWSVLVDIRYSTIFVVRENLEKREVCYEKDSAFGRVVYDGGFFFCLVTVWQPRMPQPFTKGKTITVLFPVLPAAPSTCCPALWVPISKSIREPCDGHANRQEYPGTEYALQSKPDGLTVVLAGLMDRGD